MPTNSTSKQRFMHQAVNVALRRTVSYAAMALVGLSAGCAGSRRQLLAATGRTITPGGSVAESDALGKKVEPLDPEVQDSLAAIEDFLARTKGYQRWPAPAALGTSMFTGNPKFNPTASPPIDEGFKPAQPAPSPFPIQQQLTNNKLAVMQGDASPVFTVTTTPRRAIPALRSVAIRWSEPSIDESQQPAPSNSTNVAFNAQSAKEVFSLDRLLGQMEQQATTRRDFASEWQLRLAQLVTDRDEDARNISHHLPSQSQRILATLIETAMSIRNLGRNPMLTGEEALAHATDLRQLLAKQADPVVSAVAFCRRVGTFGVYDPMTSDDFVAGHSIEAIVYSEVANLSSELNSEGLFETRLSTRLEVLTADGESVWQHEEAEIIDVCRRRRTDFFVVQRVTLPPTLPVGDYVLKVLVADRLSGRADEAAHAFAISSPLSVARGG